MGRLITCLLLLTVSSPALARQDGGARLSDVPNVVRISTAFGVITSEAMNTVKNSAVTGTIGLAELSSQAGRIIEFTAVPVEAFIIILAGYIFLNALVLGASKLTARVILKAQ